MSEISKAKVSKNLMLYTMGNLVSMMGTFMYNFAVGLYVLKVTGSGTSYALTVVFGILPRVILSPFAGVYADKVNKKTVVVLMDILSGLLLLGLFGLTQTRELSLVLIYASSALLTIFNVFFGVSFEASMPNLVDDNSLMKINSISSSIRALAMIIAPIAGGILYFAVGIKTFILINGISFFLSGISEWFINFELNSKEKEQVKAKTSIMADFKEGIQYLKSQKSIMSLMKYALLINFLMMSFNIVYPYILVVDIKLSEVHYGIVQAAFAVGTLVFSIWMSTRNSKNAFSFKKMGALMFALSIMVLAIGIIASPMVFFGSALAYVVLFCIINFLVGADTAVLNIPIQTELMMRVDENHRGKVLGLLSAVAMGLSPIAAMLFGTLLDFVPGYILMLVTAILLAIISMAMVKEKQVDAQDSHLNDLVKEEMA